MSTTTFCSFTEMHVNENSAYSILIRANLQSEDLLITSTNRRIFGQKIQVLSCKQSNNQRIFRQKNSRYSVANNNKFKGFLGKKKLQAFVGQCSNRSSVRYIKEDFLYHRLIECTKRYLLFSTIGF